jgi:hypothetical protein
MRFTETKVAGDFLIELAEVAGEVSRPAGR